MVLMDSVSKEQPVQMTPPIDQTMRQVVTGTNRDFWAPLDRTGVLSKIVAAIFWIALGCFVYSALQISSDRTTPFGTALLQIVLEAAGCSLLARYLLGAAARLYRLPAIGFFVTIAIIGEFRLTTLIREMALNMPQLLALWGAIAGALLMLGWTLDPAGRTRSAAERAGVRSDLLIATAVLLLSLSLRLLGPVTAAVDEVIIYGEMLNLGRFPHTKFWDTSTTANPYFIHWLVYLASTQIQQFVDSFVFEKFVTSFFASLSIALWYWVINMLCGRRVALTASVLLAFFGWHWVNSRFLYVYPYELAAISFATACGILAFGRGKFLAAAALGITLTFSMLAKKISIMIFPLTAYLFLEYLIIRPTVSRKRIVLTLVAVVAVFLLTYRPFIAADANLAAHITTTDRFFRFNQALEARRVRLEPLGLTPTQAYVHIFKDAVHQLFVKSSDAFRHYFRPSGPLLDPIVSWVGVLGFSLCAALCFWRRECRLALVGLVLFALPMVLSFPLDSIDNQGVARRMIGISLFLVLIAAIGADFISKIFARFIPRWIIPALICIASATANIHDYFTKYSTQPMIVWVTDHGLRRGALLLAARDAVRHGATVLVLDNHTYSAQEGLVDLSKVSFLPSETELRSAITSVKSGKVMVIIPGGGSAYAFDRTPLAKQLADLIPEQSWVPGRPGPSGEPLIVTATIERSA